jgi:hypothetical protein
MLMICLSLVLLKELGWVEDGEIAHNGFCTSPRGEMFVHYFLQCGTRNGAYVVMRGADYPSLFAIFAIGKYGTRNSL